MNTQYKSKTTMSYIKIALIAALLPFGSPLFSMEGDHLQADGSLRKSPSEPTHWQKDNRADGRTMPNTRASSEADIIAAAHTLKAGVSSPSFKNVYDTCWQLYCIFLAKKDPREEESRRKLDLARSLAVQYFPIIKSTLSNSRALEKDTIRDGIDAANLLCGLFGAMNLQLFSDWLDDNLRFLHERMNNVEMGKGANNNNNGPAPDQA